jgi:diacylglycerol kinase
LRKGYVKNAIKLLEVYGKTEKRSNKNARDMGSYAYLFQKFKEIINALELLTGIGSCA